MEWRWTPGRGHPGLESVGVGAQQGPGVLNGGGLMDSAGLGGSSRASTKRHSKGDAPNAEGNALRPPGRARPVGVVLGHLQRAHTAQRPVYVLQLCSCPCEMGLPGLEVTIVGGEKGGDTWARRAPHFLLRHRGPMRARALGLGKERGSRGAHLTPPQAALAAGPPSPSTSGLCGEHVTLSSSLAQAAHYTTPTSVRWGQSAVPALVPGPHPPP